MLNRNKLVTQFEQVVQQEIKNHNDSVLSTNISINQLRQTISDLINEFRSYKAQIESKVQKQESQICLQKEIIEDLIAKIQFNISSNSIFKDNFERVRGANVVELDVIKKNTQSLERKIIDFESLYKKTKEELSKLKSNEEQEKNLFHRVVNDKIINLKDEILSIPSQMPELKKELEEKISCAYVDFQGVMRELQIIKRTSFIQEKKIENIYTLIDRLKGDVRCHKPE